MCKVLNGAEAFEAGCVSMDMIDMGGIDIACLMGVSLLLLEEVATSQLCQLHQDSDEVSLSDGFECSSLSKRRIQEDCFRDLKAKGMVKS